MSARNFPFNTCGASRHVEMLAEQLSTDGRSAMIESEAGNCAESMTATVEALYSARTRIEHLERVLAQAREAFNTFDGVGDVVTWDGQWSKCHAAIAAIDEALKS